MKIDPAVLKALRQGTELPDAKLNALATFVRTLVRTKGHISEADLNSFIAAGYTREQGLGVLIGVAMKTIGNLVNHSMKTPLDQQFAAQRWEDEGSQRVVFGPNKTMAVVS
jgi:alkylhydroperoxidase family enzyme